MNEEEKLAGADPALDAALPADNGLEKFTAQVKRVRKKRGPSRKAEDESGGGESSRNWPFNPVEPLAKEMVLDPRLRPAPLFDIPYGSANTEEMLHGLIAECHFLMRHVSLPTMCTGRDTSIRREFLNSAMELVRTGAHVAETIGHLRHVEHKAARKAARR